MVLECDQPPQTVREAMAEGWHALAVECPSCKHGRYPREGRLHFKDMDAWSQHALLADIFARAKCDRCGRRPRSAKLAAAADFNGLISWHEKPVLIIDGFVVRPGRW